MPVRKLRRVRPTVDVVLQRPPAASNKPAAQGVAKAQATVRSGPATFPLDRKEGDPEAVLWLAVIQQALSDAVSVNKEYRAELDRNSARRWFKLADRDFRDVCIMAGLEPECVRRIALDVMARADAGMKVHGGNFSGVETDNARHQRAYRERRRQAAMSPDTDPEPLPEAA